VFQTKYGFLTKYLAPTEIWANYTTDRNPVILPQKLNLLFPNVDEDDGAMGFTHKHQFYRKLYSIPSSESSFASNGAHFTLFLKKSTSP